MTTVGVETAHRLRGDVEDGGDEADVDQLRPVTQGRRDWGGHGAVALARRRLHVEPLCAVEARWIQEVARKSCGGGCPSVPVW